jgi:hypothetical protein
MPPFTSWDQVPGCVAASHGRPVSVTMGSFVPLYPDRSNLSAPMVAEIEDRLRSLGIGWARRGRPKVRRMPTRRDESVLLYALDGPIDWLVRAGCTLDGVGLQAVQRAATYWEQHGRQASTQPALSVSSSACAATAVQPLVLRPRGAVRG